MMNRKNLYMLILLIVNILVFTACSLAKPENEEMSDDRLIGIVITEEYIDTFDVEQYLNDNINKISEDGDLMIEDTSGYENKIYGKNADFIDKNEDFSNNEIDPMAYFEQVSDVVFEGVDGMNLFIYDKHVDGSSESAYTYPSTIFDEKISSAKFSIDQNSSDEVSLLISGTLYVSSDIDTEIISYYVNPVYQDEEGRIYMTSGTGISSNVAGSIFSMSKREEEVIEITFRDREMMRKILIDITFELKHPHEKIVLIEMNASNEVVAEHEYDPNDMPPYFIQKKETEYIIGEFYSMDFDGKEIVERKIYEYERSGGSLVTYYQQNEDYTLTERHMPIEWYIGKNSVTN